MTHHDQDSTQRDLPTGIAAELAAAGFGAAEEIGHGGFGVVYRCYEYALKRHVAVKVLMSEVHGDERQQFVREQQALGRLSGHPHIVQVLQVDITATGRPYIVMPYHAQGSLERLLHSSGPLRWPDVLSIGVKMAGALAAAHAVDIVHRDVKPGNILLTDYGEPQLSDFGIAHVGEVSISSPRTIQGTPAFTAPEVLAGATPTQASDVYGLGATLFSLLTGHAAFARRTGEPLEVQLARIAAAPRPDLSEEGIPQAVCAAVEAAMAADPADRPASAADFGEQLREAQRQCGQVPDVMAVPTGKPAADTASAALPVPIYSGRAHTPPAPPIPAAKFRLPSLPRALIERTRLLDVLRRGVPRRLTVIDGPAGFGKTTLAAQWGRLLESEGVAVAWMSADTDDDNVVWFLAHLVEAIRRVRPELARELGALLEERASDTGRSVLTALIDEIHESGRALILVVDDWHRVTNAATIAALDYLLEYGCHHLRIVVVSRTRSGLPFTSLLVQDELVEIDAPTLRFDAVETRAFLVEKNHLPLTAEQLARLQEATEGWAAVLQLASVSLRDHPDPGAFIDQLIGRHHVIGEYLAENVLNSLDPALLDFLLSSSVTDRTCADLAAALSGRSDGGQLLEQVAEENLFMHRLDEDPEWFRYNRLFAAYLRRKLVTHQPDRLTRLHRQASDWFAEHDLLREAVDHALAAGDPQHATDLVEAHAHTLIEDARMATCLGLVAKLPAGLAQTRPRLQLCVAWANLGLQRPRPMRVALHFAHAALAAGAAPEPQAAELLGEAAIVTSVHEYVTDRPDGLPDIVAGHMDNSPSPFFAISAANVAAVDALNRFEFDEVLHCLRRAAPYALGHRGPFQSMHGRCIGALALYEELDVAAAEHLVEAAVAGARRDGAPTHSSIMAGALLGRLRYEQGHLSDARELLDASARLGRLGGPVDFLIATYGIGARLAALQGDLTTAQELLAEGATIAADGSLPRLTAAVLNERIRLGLPIPGDTRARLVGLPSYRKQDNRIDAGIAELDQDSAIRLLLAGHTRAEAATACTRAARMVRQIETQHRPRAMLQAQLLHGCCLWAAQHHDQAIQLLTPALALCATHGLPRLAADAGPQIAEATIL
jgi:serine/threonine-protein kinase PknK